MTGLLINGLLSLWTCQVSVNARTNRGASCQLSVVTTSIRHVSLRETQTRFVLRTAPVAMSTPLQLAWRGVGVVLTGYIGNKLTTRIGYTGKEVTHLALEGDLCRDGA